MNRPLLSIVIANYNYGRFLEEAIQSVLSQNVNNRIELIICDAASNDDSVEIIKKYAHGLPANTARSEWEDIQCKVSKLQPESSKLISWWCSEKDGGQSAAFNKGFAHSNGEWLTWLNADDILLPGSIMEFFKLVARIPEATWVTGNQLSFKSDSRTIEQVNWGPHVQPPFLRYGRAFSEVFGPTTFLRKSLYEKMGPIDESLHFAMDTEYWARLTMSGIRQTRLNHLCWGFRLHEDSKTEGAQSEERVLRRTAETNYWRNKTKYRFVKSFRNPWYVAWCFWRLLDFSWIVRFWKKFSLEGRPLSCISQVGLKESFKVRIFEPTVPEYRVALFTGLASRYPNRIEIVTADPNSCHIKGAICDYDHKRVEIGPVSIYKGLTLNGLERGDVITVDGSPKSISPMMIALRARLDGIGVVWWGHHVSANPRWYRVMIRIWIARLLSDVFLCYTDAGVKFLVEHGYPKDRVFATGNTIDTSAINAEIASISNGQFLESFKRENGLSGCKILLFCGRLRPRNGLDVLFEALVTLNADAERYICVVVGNGPEWDQLHSLAIKLNVDRYVKWVGELRGQHQLAPWFMSADLFVYPGTIGLSLIHAMAYGLPVVVNDNPWIHGPEYVAFENGVNGWAFKENSPASLADTIIEVFSNEDELRKRAISAKAKIQAEYSIEQMINRTTQAIESARM